jgi:hypothetical protein
VSRARPLIGVSASFDDFGDHGGDRAARAPWITPETTPGATWIGDISMCRMLMSRWREVAG